MAVNKRWNGSGYIDLTTNKRWDGTSWISLTVGKRWDGTSWLDILGGGGGSGLSVTADKAALFGNTHSTGPYPLVASVTTDTVTITATGGTSPYSYLWTQVSGDSAVQVVSPQAAITAYTANVGREQQVKGTKRCTVTDSLGATGSVDVPGTLTHTTDL